jgi:hypothetical protein
MIQDTPVRSPILGWPSLPDIWAANYLNDLWLFDMQEYKWKQIVMKDNERKPSWVFNLPSSTIFCLTAISPRSGFSFLPTPEGIILHGTGTCFSPSACLIDAIPGGYCKEYSKGKRPIGIMLDDTWFLK